MISIVHNEDRTTVKLVGRLVGSCVEDLRNPTLAAHALEVDLSGLIFADGDGERSLMWGRDALGSIPPKRKLTPSASPGPARVD